MDEPNAFPFMSLAQELRFMVYESIPIVTKNRIVVKDDFQPTIPPLGTLAQENNKDTTRISPDIEELEQSCVMVVTHAMDPAILCTSRLIRDEAAPIMRAKLQKFLNSDPVPRLMVNGLVLGDWTTVALIKAIGRWFERLQLLQAGLWFGTAAGDLSRYDAYGRLGNHWKQHISMRRKNPFIAEEPHEYHVTDFPTVARNFVFQAGWMLFLQHQQNCAVAVAHNRTEVDKIDISVVLMWEPRNRLISNTLYLDEIDSLHTMPQVITCDQLAHPCKSMKRFLLGQTTFGPNWHKYINIDLAVAGNSFLQDAALDTVRHRFKRELARRQRNDVARRKDPDKRYSTTIRSAIMGREGLLRWFRECESW